MTAADDIREAVALAQNGAWNAAHAIVQRHEADPLACWLHAILHTIEGDRGNAGYWYARAGRTPHAFKTSEAELAAIAAEAG